MARVPDPPDADRFYARILSAALECPRCGWLDSFHWRKMSRKSVSERVRHLGMDGIKGWDPLTGVWRCAQCGSSFVLGVLAWPVATGGQGTPITRARDQVPNERQLAQMRARGGGLWMPTRVSRSRAESTNVTARCSCVPARMGTLPWTGEPEQVDPECPIHGAKVPPP